MRYDVATVEGYPTEKGLSPGGGTRRGLSAHVLDTLDCCRVVAMYRSEDRPKHPDGTYRQSLGVEGALAAAGAEAERRNRLERFAA